jgi:hypothetical protein
MTQMPSTIDLLSKMPRYMRCKMCGAPVTLIEMRAPGVYREFACGTTKMEGRSYEYSLACLGKPRA